MKKQIPASITNHLKEWLTKYKFKFEFTKKEKKKKEKSFNKKIFNSLLLSFRGAIPKGDLYVLKSNLRYDTIKCTSIEFQLRRQSFEALNHSTNSSNITGPESKKCF